MAGPMPIQAAYAIAAGQIEEVRVALPYEPGQTRLPSMPCVTMLFTGVEQDDTMTGPFQEVRWHWDVFLYVNFADAERAQLELLAIVPQLVRIVRVDPSLGGTCELAEIEDALATPELGPEDRWLRKRIHLNALLEEA